MAAPQSHKEFWMLFQGNAVKVWLSTIWLNTRSATTFDLQMAYRWFFGGRLVHQGESLWAEIGFFFFYSDWRGSMLRLKGAVERHTLKCLATPRATVVTAIVGGLRAGGGFSSENLGTSCQVLTSSILAPQLPIFSPATSQFLITCPLLFGLFLRSILVYEEK